MTLFFAALGAVLGVVLVLGVVPELIDLPGEDIAVEPAVAPLDYTLAHERLFVPRNWAKGTIVPAAVADPAAYNRPLEVDVVPDNEILPPPRVVRGVNHEG